MRRILGAASADVRLASELAARYRRAYRTVSVTHATVHPGVSDALAALRDAGHALTVVSSKPSGFSRPILQAVALLELFDGVFGPEGEESEPKDETLARALAAREERPAIMVGDTVQDIAAARANRVPCIAVGWGYGVRSELESMKPAALDLEPSQLLQAVGALAAR